MPFQEFQQLFTTTSKDKSSVHVNVDNIHYFHPSRPGQIGKTIMFLSGDNNSIALDISPEDLHKMFPHFEKCKRKDDVERSAFEYHVYVNAGRVQTVLPVFVNAGPMQAMTPIAQFFRITFEGGANLNVQEIPAFLSK
jgi:hypothetical protein